MKFSKEMEQDLVPEWRMKYLDYKIGKRHVRALSRAQSRVGSSHRNSILPTSAPRKHSLYGSTSPIASRENLTSSNPRLDGSTDEPTAARRLSQIGSNSRVNSEKREPASNLTKAPPITIPAHVGEPSDGNISPGGFDSGQSPNGLSPVTIPNNAHQVRRTLTSPLRNTFESHRERVHPKKNARPFMRRLFAKRTPLEPATTQRLDAELIVVDQIKSRQQQFFDFMDNELEKVETFYKLKEDEAGERLKVLREQLHEMRNRRIEEVARAQRVKKNWKQDETDFYDPQDARLSAEQYKKGDDYSPSSADRLTAWLDPLGRVYGNAKAKIIGPQAGKNLEAWQNVRDSQDDGKYIRRPRYSNGVPYRTAKRKLKLALQEHYRGMELLKSYALLNRIAFRKMNKKYDKAVDAHPPLRFVSEKVNKAWFVQSDVLDSHINAVEDLYAEYFERGNRKIAAGKLRCITRRKVDQSGSAFRNGILIGIGAVFATQGTINGIKLLKGPDPLLRVQTSYLFQIYGGYFLALYLFSWFCLSCNIWNRNKINYQFVFEFDPRHNLDWRQLSEFPSFLILLLGLFVWLNFSRYGSPEMFLYYPAILIFVTVLIIFFPGPYMFHRSRKWFIYSHWRLLLAGIYSVQFRDFFLGDMYCSLTYFMGNIALFFCLYANYWNNPRQCNSSNSRLLGFFTALPGIWRVLQCLRRYFDTMNVFPHMVNCVKYAMTIAYCVTLSMYRIEHTRRNLAIFIAFATINSIYCSIWDLLMDWSLLQPNASKRWLRDVRAYQNPYCYYVAMILDPIFRFNWILYIFYTHNLQQSSLVAFLVAFSEVTRRGIWILIRVENEHCSNVARFKASRDVPLPYSVYSDAEDEMRETECPPTSSTPEAHTTQAHTLPARAPMRSYTSTTLESQQSAGSSFRHRPGMQHGFSAMVANAHTQDFEKKWKPGAGEGDNASNNRRDGDNGNGSGEDKSGNDDDEDDAVYLREAETILRESPWLATFK
ncbi:EXS family protein [Diplocarpon rosae]|nr:EXS family protein [Diplocarpon rosae]